MRLAGLISYHYRVVEGELDVLSIPFRYVWPSELDTRHVSVWERTASP